jgi:hypothetical protein
VFWWCLSAAERARPKGAIELGRRPDLRPVDHAMDDGRVTVHGDDDFRPLIDRFG